MQVNLSGPAAQQKFFGLENKMNAGQLVGTCRPTKFLWFGK
jgi:hypothetical protein